jgi:hypothetical protein
MMISKFESNTLFCRIVHRTGKVYLLTLTSMSHCVIAGISLSLWNFNTSALHLWMDLIPYGFGIAVMTTTTPIVSIYAPQVMS